MFAAHVTLKYESCAATRDYLTNVLEADQQASLQDNGQTENDSDVVYVITPTYDRPAQLADMTRLGQTLKNLDFIFWIVVEDGPVSYSMCLCAG